MFAPISKKQEDLIKSSGKLYCTATASTDRLVNEFKITYVKHHSIPPEKNDLLLFTYRALKTAKSLALYKFENAADLFDFPEALKFFFLDWAIKELSESSKKNGNDRVVIRSKLPHFTEILVENKFDKIDKVDELTFKGTKIFKEKSQNG